MPYRVKFACQKCGVVWTGKLRELSDPDPDCPNLNCQAMQEIRGMDFDNPRAPAAIGMSNMTKAIDETAKITMEDHGLTDLRSDVRPGETMTPKLPPKLQAQADAVFGAKTRKTLMGVNPAVLRAKINAGSYAPGQRGMPDVVGDAHRQRLKPKINIIASDQKG